LLADKLPTQTNNSHRQTKRQKDPTDRRLFSVQIEHSCCLRKTFGKQEEEEEAKGAFIFHFSFL